MIDMYIQRHLWDCSTDSGFYSNDTRCGIWSGKTRKDYATRWPLRDARPCLGEEVTIDEIEGITDYAAFVLDGCPRPTLDVL